jgi:hypothetical protein
MITDEQIKENRLIFVDHEDWWEGTENNFTERMRSRGVEVERVFFSGFWSQGDGACFEGSICDMDDFLKFYFNDDEYPFIRRLLKENGAVNLSCHQHGYYSHANSVLFSEQHDTWELIHHDEEDEFRLKVINAMDEKLADELTDFYSAAHEIFRDAMRSLYDDLQAEYEYLTSDETIREYLEDQEEEEDQ